VRRGAGDYSVITLRRASVPRSEGPCSNYSIAAPCVHLAAHAVFAAGRSCPHRCATVLADLTASVSFCRIQRCRQRRMRCAFVGDCERCHTPETFSDRAIAARTALAARKRKRLGDQRALRVRCEALSQMQNGVEGGGAIGVWQPQYSGCASCLAVGDATFGRGIGIIPGEATWRTGCRR
jgi:hypothetical protein